MAATTKHRAEGARLKEARGLLRLTQEALASRIGSSLATVKSWERGNSLPNRQYAAKLSDLGINLGYVFHGEEEALIPPGRRQAYGEMVDRTLSAEGAHLAQEPMAQLRTSTQALSDLCVQLDFTPPVHWVVLVQELMLVDGLPERAARRILETLREDGKARP